MSKRKTLKQKNVEATASQMTQAYVIGLMKLEEHYGVQMLSETTVELETDTHVWIVKVTKEEK